MNNKLDQNKSNECTQVEQKDTEKGKYDNLNHIKRFQNVVYSKKLSN